MKRLLGSTGAKLLAGVLLFVSVLTLALSIVAGIVLTEFSALRGDGVVEGGTGELHKTESKK